MSKVHKYLFWPFFIPAERLQINGDGLPWAWKIPKGMEVFCIDVNIKMPPGTTAIKSFAWFKYTNGHFKGTELNYMEGFCQTPKQIVITSLNEGVRWVGQRPLYMPPQNLPLPPNIA